MQPSLVSAEVRVRAPRILAPASRLPSIARSDRGTFGIDARVL